MTAIRMTNLEEALHSEEGQQNKKNILLQLQSHLSCVNRSLQSGNTPSQYKHLLLQHQAIALAIDIVYQYTNETDFSTQCIDS